MNNPKPIILVIIFLFLNFVSSFAQTPTNYNGVIGKEVPITGNTEQLQYFFNALQNSHSEKIRIAHYGDSIIWGDIITDNLRVYFQNKYGGHGIGFIPIFSDGLSARRTISSQFSGDWKWASVFTKNRDKFPIGIAGTVGKASANSTLSFNLKNISEATKFFTELSVYHSNTNPNSLIRFTVDNGNEESVELVLANRLDVTTLIFEKKTRDIKLELINCNGTFFYGVTLDSGNGIYVDNFPFKGNSGVSLRDLSEELLPVFAENLNYKLFILQFGANIVASGNIKYQWYERMMLRVIEKIKKFFPETSILIVSPGDIGEKRGRTIRSYPEIEKLIAIQEKIAVKGKVAFWNMFEAMGGENSISKWVEAKPPLAFKDYCHLTWEGGEVISNKLVSALMKIKRK